VGLSSPVVAGGRVYFSASDCDTLYALEAESGKLLWSYTTGGSIDTPPTIYRGMALFGSSDGWVYCLKADDGNLLWRRRAALSDRQIVDHGQFASPWPLHGNILVFQDTAYYCSGRSSFLDGGITIDAIRPETGELLAMKHLYTPDPETGDMPSDR
jgi:outer membrane protein assembly factor BamB